MQKSNIDWCDHVLNPIIGCKHNCSFGCYAERDNKRFKWVKKWNEPETKYGWTKKLKAIKEPSRIFVGSLTDLFGDWVRTEQIENVIREIKHHPQHTFMFLTKNPKRYNEFNFPENCWLGTTVTSYEDSKRAAALAFSPRGRDIKGRNQEGNICFVSVEPLLGQVDSHALTCTDWIIIGALTGLQASKHKPDKKVIKLLLYLADYYEVPVFMKDNLKGMWPGKLRKEYPK